MNTILKIQNIFKDIKEYQCPIVVSKIESLLIENNISFIKIKESVKHYIFLAENPYCIYLSMIENPANSSYQHYDMTLEYKHNAKGNLFLHDISDKNREYLHLFFSIQFEEK